MQTISARVYIASCVLVVLLFGFGALDSYSQVGIDQIGGAIVMFAALSIGVLNLIIGSVLMAIYRGLRQPRIIAALVIGGVIPTLLMIGLIIQGQ